MQALEALFLTLLVLIVAVGAFWVFVVKPVLKRASEMNKSNHSVEDEDVSNEGNLT